MEVCSISERKGSDKRSEPRQASKLLHTPVLPDRISGVYGACKQEQQAGLDRFQDGATKEKSTPVRSAFP